MSAWPGRLDRTRRQHRRTWAVLTATLIAAAAPLTSSIAADSAAAPWQVAIDEPRPFGHTVGDVVWRRVVVTVPDGYTLDAQTLPTAGRRGVAIELRRLTRQQSRDGAGSQLALTLEYQVFIAPREVRTFELPSFVLGFKGLPRPQDVRIDAWPMTISPLVPVEVSPRRGLGELQPDAPPPLIDTSAGRWRLAAYGAIAALLLAYLALVYVGLPWFSRQRRPFTAAWRSLKAMPATAEAAQRRQAFQRLHEALNQTAGEVVFEQTIDRFVAAQPRFAGLRSELAAFFQRSRAEFFGGAESAAAPGPEVATAAGAWLTEFCRQCRDAERGAA